MYRVWRSYQAICSTQGGKAKREIQEGWEKSEGNFQASGEGKSQDKSHVADQRVTNP